MFKSARPLLLIGLIFFSPMSFAQDRYVAINTALAEEIFLPNYAVLKSAALKQMETWNATCTQPHPGHIKTLKKTFHQTMDAWAMVFHWNLGPITHYLRSDRLYHWPERRNAIGKSLSRLLQDRDPDKLKPDAFAKTSVANQGLPALERLLFGTIDISKNRRACDIGKAISANIYTIANSVDGEWRTDITPRLKEGKAHPDFFIEPSDFTNRIFNELMTGFQIIRDQKILAPLGSQAEKAKPNLLENRRSARFERNLKINLQALQETHQVIRRFLSKTPANDLDSAFKDSRSRLLAIGAFSSALNENEGRELITEFLSSLDLIRDRMSDAYVSDLGLVIGFNALDGD